MRSLEGNWFWVAVAAGLADAGVLFGMLVDTGGTLPAVLPDPVGAAVAVVGSAVAVVGVAVIADWARAVTVVGGAAIKVVGVGGAAIKVVGVGAVTVVGVASGVGVGVSLLEVILFKVLVLVLVAVLGLFVSKKTIGCCSKDCIFPCVWFSNACNCSCCCFRFVSNSFCILFSDACNSPCCFCNCRMEEMPV